MGDGSGEHEIIVLLSKTMARWWAFQPEHLGPPKGLSDCSPYSALGWDREGNRSRGHRIGGCSTSMVSC